MKPKLYKLPCGATFHCYTPIKKEREHPFWYEGSNIGLFKYKNREIELQENDSNSTVKIIDMVYTNQYFETEEEKKKHYIFKDLEIYGGIYSAVNDAESIHLTDEDIKRKTISFDLDEYEVPKFKIIYKKLLTSNEFKKAKRNTKEFGTDIDLFLKFNKATLKTINDACMNWNHNHLICEGLNYSESIEKCLELIHDDNFWEKDFVRNQLFAINYEGLNFH